MYIWRIEPLFSVKLSSEGVYVLDDLISNSSEVFVTTT